MSEETETPAVKAPSPPSTSATPGEIFEVSIYLGAHGILATRGAATDSFARLLFITTGQVEWEIGRTELVSDDLTPNWRKTLRFTYTAEALKKKADSLVRIEICDPKVAPDSRELFTVMGASQILLSDLHALIRASSSDAKAVLETVTAPSEDEFTDKSTVASRGVTILESTGDGAALLSMELHQKATLQGLLAPRKKKKSKADKKREAALAQSKKALAASSDEDEPSSPPPKKSKKGKPLKEETPKQMANRIMRGRPLGTVLAAFEHVRDTRASCKLEVTGDKLKANNCAIKKVDPYLRVYRKLTTSLEGDKKAQKEIAAGPWAPTRACLLKTVYHRSTKKPTWGIGLEEILLPEQMLNNRADPDATLIFEAWDNQTTSKDRLIGYFEAKVEELRVGTTKRLKAPHFWNGRQDMADILTCFIGFGPTGRPGELQVKLAPGPKLDFSTHHKAFSVDALYLRLAGKQAVAEGVVWTSLADRRSAYMDEINTGEEVIKKSFWKVLSRTSTNMAISVEGATADWSRGVKANSPFYQSHLRIGSEFGSAMKAYFKFFSSMITLNLVLFLLQFPVWIPQILFLQGVNPVPELLSALTAGTPKTADDVSAASEASSGELLLNTSSLGTPNAGVLYFDAYEPRVAMSTDPATGEMNYYPLGTVYLLCGFACLVTSIIWVVLQLRRKMRNPDAAVSSASPLGPGSADILAALFGMWDHSLCYSADATSKVRREIITRIKEGEAEAERATEANSVVRSLSERRLLVIRRFFLLLVAILISGVGTAGIVLCVLPPTKKEILKISINAFGLLIGTNVPMVFVTAINGVGPLILKTLVKFEEWSSPAVTLRQTTYRIFILKMVNSLAIYFGLNLGNPDIPCPEKDAGATMMQLIWMDFLIGVVSFFVPKWITLNCIPRTVYTVKKCLGLGKKNAKTDPIMQPGRASTATMSPPPSPSPSPPSASAPADSARPHPAVTASLPSPGSAARISAADAAAPTPPPSPPEDDEDDEQAKWNEWKSQKKSKTPASMKDAKPWAPDDDDDEEEEEAKYEEEEEEGRFTKWKTTRRRDPLGAPVGTSEADLPDKDATKKPRKPDYPLINSEAKGAPELQIPVEITKILYRQMLLWIGMLISPFIFGLGLLSTFFFYWVQYGTVVYLHKRPKKILDHFAAADTQRDFYGAFLIANAFAFVFFVMFSTLPTNPVCGPLRSFECAEGFKLGNLTACAADARAQRKNYNWLSDTLLPPDDTTPQAIFALAGGNNTKPVAPVVVCDAVCRAKYIFQICVSTQVLLPLAFFFVVVVTFVSASWARNARELREARKELAIEYQDKKMLARYARVEV